VGVPTSLHCPRCGQGYPPDTATVGGCLSCEADGVGVNLVCKVRWEPEEARSAIVSGDPQAGFWRYSPLLPVAERFAVTLGEGDTALLHAANLGRAWGASRLYLKVEAQNPTCSHKDRLCSVGVAVARSRNSAVVTGCSTGNHGASIAAYAARAGLRCVIFTLASVPNTMKTLMQSYGAEVVACRTLEERFAIMVECVRQFGWTPLTNGKDPPIGSTPFGSEGYKTIAYELWTQLNGDVPDWLVIPVGYGDCLAGILRGWEDLRALGLVDRIPRLIAAEVFGALARAVARPDGPFGPVPIRPTHAFSIGGAYSTYQAVAAVRDSRGRAAGVDEAHMMWAQLELGRLEGVYAEASSATALGVAHRLIAEGFIGSDDLTVVLLTSSGLKDPAATAESLPAVEIINPTIEELLRCLRHDWQAHGDEDSTEQLYFPPPATTEGSG
jgi:threonine synthase